MPNYPFVTAAIEKFLQHTKNQYNEDLVTRYSRAMEVQVNVHPGDGTLSEDARNVFTNGTLSWFNFRVPRKAMSDPEHNDWKIKWPLESYADGIGMTGWDWDKRVSRWVAYDFDNITEHAKGVGIADNDLIEVAEKAKNIKWVQVRKSTGGGGLHLYVYLNSAKPPKTENHNEHAALARSILGLMSAEAGFDFQAKLDVCGSNMWIWHTKLSEENEGLKIIKQHEYELVDWPLNWKDHLPVITRKRQRIVLTGVEDTDESSFNTLSNARKREPLDDVHKAMIDYLESGDFQVIWNSDHHCLQTHSFALLEYAQYLKGKNDPIRGIYKTSSRGNDKAKPNCFCFPMESGAWKIVRFGRGVAEAKTWQHDKENWTWCFFNRRPDLAMAALACDALESTGRGYEFINISDAQEAISHLGTMLKLPDNFEDRKLAFKSHKDGRLIVTAPQMGSDTEDDMRATGWVLEAGKKWQQIYDVQTRIKDTSAVAPELDDVDGQVRALNTTAMDSSGFMLKHVSGEWSHQPMTSVKNYLKSRGYKSDEADAILGDSSFRAWRTVNIPFGPEYPGNRDWNRDAAQLRYVSAEVEPSEVKHPHWDMVMAHCGRDLDNQIKVSPWAKKYGILSGRDYLIMWIACMLREPFDRLPYLFFFGNQNCGKSIFQEAIGLLMTKGCVQADTALQNTAGFNGEIHEAVLCFVEEVDLSKAGTIAYNRIKEYVTNDKISVHVKFMQPFMASNTTHWCQMANNRDSLPIFPGDTRIIIMHVADLMNEIPKAILLTRLQEEAPHFMRTLFDLQLPAFTGRLRLPIITTSSKEAAEEAGRDALEVFLEENVYYVPGSKIEFKDFFMRFNDSLQGWEKTFWPKRKVATNMPTEYPIGVSTGNKRYIGNIDFQPAENNFDAPRLILHDKKLVLEKVTE